MKKQIFIIVLLLVFLFMTSIIMGATIPKNRIPSDVQWLIHFDMNKFKTTHLFEQMQKREKPFQITKKVDKLNKTFKIDVFKDIDSVTVFGKEGREENTAVLVSGNLDKEHLLWLLGIAESHDEEAYGQFTIHYWDDDEVGAFVDDRTVLIAGSETSIKDTLDVIAGKGKDISSSPLMSYIKDISSDAYISAVVDDISSMMKGHGPRILRQSGRAFFTAMEKNQNINLKLFLDVGTAEVAKNMEQVIRGMIAMVNLYENETLKDLKIQDALNITQKDNTIQMELNYPVEELTSKALERKMKDLFHMSAVVF